MSSPRSRPASLSPGRALLLSAALALTSGFSGCRDEGHLAAYRFDDHAAYSVRYDAALEGRAEGFRGSRSYSSSSGARIAFTAATDSASGRIELTLSADTLSFRASDRDDQEGAYMEERLKRYRARLILGRSGQILILEEEPDLPPLEFSPLNFGRFIAYGLPAFPAMAVKAGSEWQVDQPLLDKFHPASRVVKRYRVQAIRETPAGRLLECKVDIAAWLEEGLAAPVPGSAAGGDQPTMTGRGEAVFNLDQGIPVSSDLELEGRFVSRIKEGATDSAGHFDMPLRLTLRLALRFPDSQAPSPR